MPGQTPRSDERELLIAYAAQQRDGIRYAAYGPTTSRPARHHGRPFSIHNQLVQHVADTERHWIDIVVWRDRSASQEKQVDEYVVRRAATRRAVVAAQPLQRRWALDAARSDGLRGVPMVVPYVDPLARSPGLPARRPSA